jgi:hypothetical protein
VSDLFLGIIALSVLVMAVVQVAGCVLLAQTARRIEHLGRRIDEELRPILANLQVATAELTRAAGLASAQIERADRFLGMLSRQTEAAAGLVMGSLLGQGRKGMAMVAAVRTLITLLRKSQRPGRKASQAVTMDEDEALFIG